VLRNYAYYINIDIINICFNIIIKCYNHGYIHLWTSINRPPLSKL